MSDDIFIKHGLGAFQQPYNARVPAAAQQPIIAQRDARQPASSRQPLIYQNRTPGTYQLPASAQTPHIRDAQTPSIRGRQQPTIKNAQEPNIRDRQNPFIRNDQTPFTYQHRTPTIYQNSYQHQSPFEYQHRSPFIERSPRNYQVPAIYQHRSPGTYPVNAQKIVNYQHRSPAITTYRHPTSTTIQTTYQVTKNQQNPFSRNQQQPYIFSFRSPFIQGYQITYNHQQPTSGFLPVTTQEFVARASELITGFGADVDIPNDQNANGISGVTAHPLGASSLISIGDGFDTFAEGSQGAAEAETGICFKVMPISSGSNDYGLFVARQNSSNSDHGGGIGNMSSTSSDSFSYSELNTTNSYNLIYRLNNIGNGRVQAKVNFPNVTAAPYSFNVSSSGVGWHSNNISNNPQGGYTSGDDLTQTGMTCKIETWPQTSLGTTEEVSNPGFGTLAAKNTFVFAHNNGTNGTGTNTLSTSYQNVPSTGRGLLLKYTEITSSIDSTNRDGTSTIVEIIVKDVDTSTEYTIDLLCVFTALADVDEESNGGED